MADLLLHIDQHSGQTRVAVIGALEVSAARGAQRRLRRAIDNTPAPQLVIDLRCCTGIDTHGILTLVAAHHAVTAHGGTLTLSAVPPLIRDRLEQEPRARHLLQTNA